MTNSKPEMEPEEELAIDDDGEEFSETDELLDLMQGTGVGTEDPNIVGDAGPTDIPPGAD